MIKNLFLLEYRSKKYWQSLLISLVCIIFYFILILIFLPIPVVRGNILFFQWIVLLPSIIFGFSESMKTEFYIFEDMHILSPQSLSGLIAIRILLYTIVNIFALNLVILGLFEIIFEYSNFHILYPSLTLSSLLILSSFISSSLRSYYIFILTLPSMIPILMINLSNVSFLLELGISLIIFPICALLAAFAVRARIESC